MDFSFFVTDFWNSMVVLGTAMVPVLELKAAIIAGRAFGFLPWQSFLLAYVGSCLPAPFVIWLLKPVMHWLRNSKFFTKLFSGVVASSLKKADRVRKYSLWGLFIFVAIPLPGTGVWSGSVISSALDLRLLKATLVVWAGNLIAGLCVLFLTYGII